MKTCNDIGSSSSRIKYNNETPEIWQLQWQKEPAAILKEFRFHPDADVIFNYCWYTYRYKTGEPCFFYCIKLRIFIFIQILFLEFKLY